MSRLRNIPGAKERVQQSRFCLKSSQEIRDFVKDRPLHMEIGMGKGRFITALSERNPGIAYLGVERYDSVLLRAIEKAEAAAGEVPENSGKSESGEKGEISREAAAGNSHENLRFMSVDAALLPEYLPEESVDRIYLNFSDPWPKDRHARRRLESREFLQIFSKFLKKGGIIEFKTDNEGLFDFALTQIEPAGFRLLEMTRDLHRDEKMNQGNIMTEYEEKFSVGGKPIFKYIIQK